MSANKQLWELLPVPTEQLVLEAQGACKTSLRSGWKPGRMILTDERFVFAGGRRVVAEVPLDAVREVRTERQPFVLARRATVRLMWSRTLAGQAARPFRDLWLITKDTRVWQEALFQMTRLELTDQTIEWVASTVDLDCTTLLWYIWHQGHAGIDELAELIDAPNHDDVLVKIRKIINPAAVKLLGCNIMVFRHRWKAGGGSEPINSHWWITGRRKTVPATAAAAAWLNVFEEPDHVDVVADLPGVKDNDVMLSVSNNRLVISAASDTEKFHEETALPPETRTETMTSNMNNGVLVVRFRRRSRRQTA